MILFNNKRYKLVFYQNFRTKEKPVDNYLNRLGKKERAKIIKYLEFLISVDNSLTFHLVKHIRDKIWELRIDFSNKRFRLMYFILDKQIVILHIFLKKLPKLQILKYQ
jgi:phage-related protein